MRRHFFPIKIRDFSIPFQTVSNKKVAFQYWEICGACGRMAKVCDVDVMKLLVVSVANRPEH